MSKNSLSCRLAGGRVMGVVVLAACGMATSALGVDAAFQGLGSLPGITSFSEAYAISGDGTSIVGYSASTPGFQAFRWRSPGGMLGLGDLSGGSFSSLARGTSANGDVVVGKGLGTSGNEAFRWESGAMIGLGGTITNGVFGSQASACSADANVIVGTRELSGFQREACRWVKTGSTYSLTGIGDLPGGQIFSNANACSTDGTVVVGAGSTVDASEAFRWVLGQGMVSLGTIPFPAPGGAAGGNFSEANACSADGSVVVGYSSDGVSNTVGFVWTTSTGTMSPLGDLAGGANDSSALGCSANGRIIVGYGTSAAGQEAVIYSSRQGMRTVKSVLDGFGVSTTGWNLRQATSVSADGTRICGIGTTPAGISSAWVATIPLPCDADFNGDGFLDFTDFDDFVLAFEAGQASADFNGDGFLDFTDFDDFVASFETGC